MNNSYRIRTVVGQDKQVKVKLDQDYEFLEILSFKIRQSELYQRDCSDYGVITGRVFANNGFGIPNAKVSVFIPLDEEDELDPVISTLYPYKTLEILNEDGYRYNLLPYVPSYPEHAATGTFPTRFDVLNNTVVEKIYNKYYKFTVTTNDSGDFMIFGVPVGMQKLFMDVDLSDIGQFSLLPQDLIRIGRGTPEQFDGYRFKSSSDLGSLPQLAFQVKDVYVSPLWGENDVCEIGITRVDFDLTTDSAIDIQPTALFMGSIFSNANRWRIKKNCKIRRNAGELCRLVTGPGQVLAIRQTILNDSSGLPVLEEATLPENGYLIDDEGTWMFDVPMNMDYITTNEFGEQVLSDDPSVGIPTTAKYRFKFKWIQSRNLNEEFRRPYYLVPNLREYGNGSKDDKDTENSYAFDLDWSGYTIQSDPNAIQDFIDAKDRFYKFEYNRIYTVASFIDNYKRQRPFRRFLGIKEISDPQCESDNNRFPANDGVYNPNIISVVVNMFTLILQPLLWLIFIIVGIVRIISFGLLRALKIPMLSFPDCEMCEGPEAYASEGVEGDAPNPDPVRDQGSGIVLPMISEQSWSGLLPPGDPNAEPFGIDEFQQQQQELLAGASGEECKEGSQSHTNFVSNTNFQTFTYQLPIAEKINLLNVRDMYYRDLTTTRVHVEPTRNNNTYHNDNVLVLILKDNNLDNFVPGQMITLIHDEFSRDPNLTGATNLNSAGTYSITGATIYENPNSITVEYGNPSFNNRFQKLTQTYALTTTGKTVESLYTFPLDIEYYQVITGMTIGDYLQFSNPTVNDDRYRGLNGIIRGAGWSSFQKYGELRNAQIPNSPPIPTIFASVLQGNNNYGGDNLNFLAPGAESIFDLFTNGRQQNIIFLQRGVDPKSPKYDMDVDLSKLFDQNWGTIKVSGQYRFNVPIQPEVNNRQPVTNLNSSAFINNNNPDSASGQYSFFKSNFYQPADSPDYSGFSTNAIRFYSALDSSNQQFKVGQTCAFGYEPTLGDLTTTSNQTLYPNSISREIRQAPQPSLARAFGENNIDDYSFTIPQITGLVGNGGPNVQGAWWYDRTTLIPPPNIPFFQGCQTSAIADIDSIPITDPGRLVRLDGGTYAHQRLFLLPQATNTPPNCNMNLQTFSVYMSPIYDESNSIRIEPASNKSETRTVLRSDRIPSSSNYLFTNGNYQFYDKGNNKFMWQQNTNMRINLVDEANPPVSFGGQIAFSPPGGIDFDDDKDQTEFLSILDTLKCPNMVGLKCYRDVPGGFLRVDCSGRYSGICRRNYAKEGVYTFVRTPLLGLFCDVQNLAEYFARLRYNFALCQGVLADIFVNNWVNGTLYMYPIQQELLYNSKNKIRRARICNSLILKHESSNNFYYRSTAYNPGTKKFQPRQIFNQGNNGGNVTQIMNPTTIVNLGPKAPTLRFTSNSRDFLGYFADQLPTSSYSDTSEIQEVFSFSRILNNSFIQNLTSTGGGAITEMFSRPGKRVDGDYAQLISINSQFGILKFDEDRYYIQVQAQSDDPVRLFPSRKNPLIGIFFSATTENLQETDYVSPGRIVFRSDDPLCSATTLSYGYESQKVAHYKWNLKQKGGSPRTLFGSEENNWMTRFADVVEVPYQKMDRRDGYYFKSQLAGQNPPNDLMERNYIWNVDQNFKYDLNTTNTNQIVVGAPNYFYFGLKAGKTALDRYFREYLNRDVNE